MDKLMKETIIKMLIDFSFQPKYGNFRIPCCCNQRKANSSVTDEDMQL